MVYILVLVHFLIDAGVTMYDDIVSSLHLSNLLRLSWTENPPIKFLL